MYMMELETSNFRFRSAGATRHEAFRNMVRTLITHAEEYELPGGYEFASRCDLVVSCLIPGGYRDGALLFSSMQDGVSESLEAAGCAGASVFAVRLALSDAAFSPVMVATTLADEAELHSGRKA